MSVIQNRYEFVLLFDVENGNPNGDPDAGNSPRVDMETNHGIITDVCLKRKVRNYVEIVRNNTDGFGIYITQGDALTKKQEGAKPKDGEDIVDAMCRTYFDIRTFGAVLPQIQKKATSKSKKDNNQSEESKDEKVDSKNGQVRGPIQINFSKSIDPIFPQTVTITRLVDENKDDKTTMGNKHIVPYALYKTEGYISANFAEFTNFSEADLELFWESLANLFEHDHSAARGKMTMRKIIVFKHESKLGNAPSHKLFDLIQVAKKADVEAPRSFTDYTININKETIPGVEIIEKM
ncbi:MAG: type I-C CRISPR-associated protein Cas7/Csd2 [Alphaproteobacteria bacterium]|jgi:CRISPR-associated protein Csd2|nr:type I-C CRISPR-associated protein Cas7/Csd2 [Alphaproteobacteria bacterium]